MNESDSKFMSLAIKRAKAGIKKGQTPFGACLVKGGKVISCEHNTVWRCGDITAHAEMVAIKKACRKLKTIDLSGCVIYSTCEPCPMCFSACHWARISRIVYGAGIRDAKASGFNELPIPNAHMKSYGKSDIKITGGVLREDNLRLFEIWRNSGGKEY